MFSAINGSIFGIGLEGVRFSTECARKRGRRGLVLAEGRQRRARTELCTDIGRIKSLHLAKAYDRTRSLDQPSPRDIQTWSVARSWSHQVGPCVIHGVTRAYPRTLARQTLGFRLRCNTASTVTISSEARK